MKVRKLRNRVYHKTGGGPNFGNRCKEYEPECIVCMGWKFLDTYGRFPRTFEECLAKEPL